MDMAEDMTSNAQNVFIIDKNKVLNFVVREESNVSFPKASYTLGIKNTTFKVV